MLSSCGAESTSLPVELNPSRSANATRIRTHPRIMYSGRSGLNNETHLLTSKTASPSGVLLGNRRDVSARDSWMTGRPSASRTHQTISCNFEKTREPFVRNRVYVLSSTTNAANAEQANKTESPSVTHTNQSTQRTHTRRCVRRFPIGELSARAAVALVTSGPPTPFPRPDVTTTSGLFSCSLQSKATSRTGS